MTELLQNPCVLLIDADEREGRWLSTLLGECGYRVSRALEPPGGGALRKLEIGAIVYANALRGEEQLEQLRRLKRLRRGIPLLLVVDSGGSHTSELNEQTIGPHEVRERPIERQSLVSWLRRSLDQPPPGDPWPRGDEVVPHHELVREMVDQANAALVMLDPRDRILLWNEAAARLFGWTRSEAIGGSFLDLVVAGDTRKADGEVLQALLAGAHDADRVTQVVAARTRSGEELLIEMALSTVKAADHRAVSAVIRDVTARERERAELLEAQRAAESASRAKSAFLANISHEIRTPLNAILGFAQLLQRDRSLDTSQTESVHTIERSAEHLLHVINEVLAMSKIEAGATTLTPSTFDLHALLRGTLQVLQPSAHEKNLSMSLVMRASDPPRYVTADQGKLRQVLLNLLNNAIKFTESGGLLLSLDCEPRQRDGIVEVTIEVIDTGPGIAPEHHELIFSKFGQGETGREKGGTGLGLPISREFVRMMGGDLVVSSELGKGATFRVTIPVDVVSTGTFQSVPARTVITGVKREPPPRVLIVDDVEPGRRALARILRGVGFEIESAGEAQLALELCQRWRPELVLMDVQLPGMDGLEATRAIKAAPWGADIEVIIVTAGVLQASQEEASRVGATAFLTKPFDNEELLRTVGEVLGLEYVRSETLGAPSRQAHEAETENDLLTALVKELPSELVDEMREAATNGDLERLQTLIGEIADGPVLAEKLNTLASAYRNEELLALLDQGPA